ncbi:ABC transporter permease [Martelella sp. AMO21009]
MLVDYTWTILAGGGMTLLLAFAALLLSTLIGMAAALAKRSHSRSLRGAAQAYTFIVRGIPDLVMILLVFYSLPALLNQLFQLWGLDWWVEFPPLATGIATLGLIFGAYMTETFRFALENIPHGQIEAAQAFGLARSRIFFRIVLPQLIRLALPGFTNNWLVLAKATALVSLIGLQDVMFRAKGAAEATGQPFTFYLVAGAFYLALTLLSTFCLARVATHFNAGMRKAGA